MTKIVLVVGGLDGHQKQPKSPQKIVEGDDHLGGKGATIRTKDNFPDWAGIPSGCIVICLWS